MVSPPKPLTILDCISEWDQLRCQVCDHPVDVAWYDDEGRTDSPLPLIRYCEKCLRTASDADWVRFQRIHEVRTAIGFILDDPRLRKALRTISQPPPPLVGYRLPDLNDGTYTFEGYGVIGFSNQSPDFLSNAIKRSTLAAAPAFDAFPVQPEDLVHRALLLNAVAHITTAAGEEPIQLPQPKSRVSVQLGIVVSPITDPEAMLIHSWRPGDPSSGYAHHSRNTGALTPAQLTSLQAVGRKLTTLPDWRGRHQGSFDRGPAWYFQRYAFLRRHLGKPPKQYEFLNDWKHLGAIWSKLDKSTLKRNLTHYGLWPWKRFVEQAESKFLADDWH